MDQNDAQTGQEAMPEEDQAEEQTTEEQTQPAPPSMEELIEEEGLKLDFPKQGETRTGVIASIGENEILVSIGTKSEGVISGREVEQIPKEELENFEVGKEIPVYVITPEDQGGALVLSYLRAMEEQDWINAEAMLESDDVYEGVIDSYNKGGLLVPFGNLRGFVPASQVSVLRRMESVGDTPDERWSDMVGESISLRVIEVDRQRHRLILSERAALRETRESIKDRLLDELEIGDIRTGRVTSLADFGAFVNIEGADGLVHLSEISWERIDHPSEVLKVGQEVQVKVISIDQDRKRIGLSIRQLLPDPWVKKVEGLREGQLVEAEITHLTKFGAFARLNNEEDLEGLIHISELSESRINHPKEVVKEGDVVTLRVIRIDTERRRIGLSLRKVDSAAYADLDWKIALSDEVEESKVQEGEVSAEAPDEEIGEPTEVEASVEAEAEALEALEPETVESEAEPEAEETPAEEAEVVAEAEAEAPEAEAPEAEEPEAEESEAEPEVEETPAEEAEVVAEVEAEAPESEEPEAVEGEAEPEAEETPAEEADVAAEAEAEAPEAVEPEAVEGEAEPEVEETPAEEAEVVAEAEAEAPEAEPELEAEESEAEPEVEETPSEEAEVVAEVEVEAPEAEEPEAAEGEAEPELEEAPAEEAEVVAETEEPEAEESEPESEAEETPAEEAEVVAEVEAEAPEAEEPEAEESEAEPEVEETPADVAEVMAEAEVAEQEEAEVTESEEVNIVKDEVSTEAE